MKSSISNDCLKAIFDYQTEPQMFPKLLLQVSVRKDQNRLVGDPNDGGLKEAGNEENNIIISDFTLRTLLLPQLKQMSERYKVMCGCECYIYVEGIHSLFLSWIYCYLEKIIDQSLNAQNRRSFEK